jgi:hypothetical protein
MGGVLPAILHLQLSGTRISYARKQFCRRSPHAGCGGCAAYASIRRRIANVTRKSLRRNESMDAMPRTLWSPSATNSSADTVLCACVGINNFNLQYLKKYALEVIEFCTKFAHHTVTIPAILSGKLFLSENVMLGGMQSSNFSYLENYASEFNELLSQDVACDGHHPVKNWCQYLQKQKCYSSGYAKIQPSLSQKAFIPTRVNFTQG